MAAKSIVSEKPRDGGGYYLDTSALLPLAHWQASQAHQQADRNEVVRGKRVADLIARGTGTSAVFATSVLAFEEVAALIRNRSRQDQTNGAWRQLNKTDPQRAVVDAIAQAKMLAMLKLAADAASSLGVSCLWPDVNGGPAAAGRKLRKAHRALLKAYVDLDAMDALHLVVGAELGFTSFVSFDAGWAVVPSVDILS